MPTGLPSLSRRILEIVREVRCLLLDGILQHVHGCLGAAQAANLVQVVGVLVAQQHGGHGLDIYLVTEPLEAWLDGAVAVTVYGEGEGALVPREQRVREGEVPHPLPVVRLEGIACDKFLDVHNAGHEVRGDVLLDLGVLQQEGQWLVGVGLPHHLGDHGEVGADEIPQPGAGLLVQKDHLLQVEDLVGNPVDEVALQLVLAAVVDGGVHVVGVPHEVLAPRQFVANQGPVGPVGELVVHLLDLRAVHRHPADFPGHLLVLGQLVVLNLVGNLVADNFPALVPVEGNGIGIEVGDVLPPLPHVVEGMLQKLVHKAVVGVLRIGSHTGEAPHVVDLAENAHPHGIDHALGDEVVPVEPAQNLSLLEIGELCPKDFLLLPAHLLQHVLGHLEHVLQKLVVLLHLLHHHLLEGELVLLHGLPPVSRHIVCQAQFRLLELHATSAR